MYVLSLSCVSLAPCFRGRRPWAINKANVQPKREKGCVWNVASDAGGGRETSPRAWGGVRLAGWWFGCHGWPVGLDCFVGLMRSRALALSRALSRFERCLRGLCLYRSLCSVRCVPVLARVWV